MVAFSGHVAAHHAVGAQVHFVKFALPQVGKVGAEAAPQLHRRMVDDELTGVGIGIGLHIHVPEALVQLRHGQLQGRFQGIELGGRGVPGNQASGRAELVLKYHHGKLRQGPVLAPEQVLEAAGRNIGGL